MGVKNEIEKQNVYTDDVFMELSNEFEQIRTCVGMYISQAGTEGALHLFKEIFNNAIDECVNPNSPSKKIYVTFNEEKREFTVTDEGRGIPFDMLRNAVTKKHVSTKFITKTTRSKETAGLNGVGLTVTAALTDYMSITTFRGRESKTIEFINGNIKESPIQKLKKEQHGLSVKIIPSEKYLGEIDLKMEIVEEYLRRMAYILPQRVKIKFYGIKNENDKMIVRDYKYLGLSTNVEYLSTTLEFQPVDIMYSCEDFDILLSFSYDKTLDDMLINSYGNYIITTEGGSHEQAAQRAICDFFSREAKKLDPNNKFEVSYEDCRKGLIMAVNCKHVNPAFEGQHKSKLSNKDILQEGKRGLNSELYNYFYNNNALLRKIIGYLRQMSKIRMEAHKIKGINIKKPTSFLDDADLKGFVNISDRNYSGYKELILTEGDSAAGAILNSRNAKNQAVYAIMGVIDNVHGLSSTQLLQKPTFRNLIKILGCGIGKEFNINKLKWDKIIICTDADVDGSNITSLLLCFFLLFLRELLDEGKVYKALPPLYIVNKKPIKRYYNGDEWLFDKIEYYHIFNQMISNNVSIILEEEKNESSGRILSKRDTMTWLELNSEYLLELDSLVKRTACDPLILEYVCYYKIIAMGDDAKFKSLIEEEFDELKYDIEEQSLYGSFNGEYISLICDKLFMKIAQRFICTLSENPAFIIWCKNKNDADDKYDRMTIGTFLKLMNSKFDIKIDQRFKGLGEAESSILFTTTMNPKIRRLIRLNINDLEKTTEIFDLLHGKGEAMREMRRELLENAKISYADIDN